MSYMSEWIYSEEELREAVKEIGIVFGKKSGKPLRMVS